MKKQFLTVLAISASLLFPRTDYAQWVENDTIYVMLKTGRTMAIGVVNNGTQSNEAPILANGQNTSRGMASSPSAMPTQDAKPGLQADAATGKPVPPPDTAAVAASIQQWRIDYNKASAAEVMAGYYVANALLLGTEGERIDGAAAIGRAFGDYQNTRPELTSTVDEVLMLPGGYAYSTVSYVNKIKNLADGTVQVSSGVAGTLHRLEDGRWKIVRQTLVRRAPQP